jgi:hypothetical protein
VRSRSAGAEGGRCGQRAALWTTAAEPSEGVRPRGIRPRADQAEGNQAEADQTGADQTGADQTGADQTGADQAEAAAALVDPEVPLEDAAVLAGAGVLDVLEESFEDPAESDDFELDSEDLPFVLARLSLR